MRRRRRRRDPRRRGGRGGIPQAALPHVQPARRDRGRWSLPRRLRNTALAGGTGAGSTGIATADPCPGRGRTGCEQRMWGFRPLTAWLAVNYLACFLSLYKLPVRIKSYEMGTC